MNDLAPEPAPAAPAAPAEPLAAKAAEQAHYESLYGGLDKIGAQLKPEEQQQLTQLTADSEDPQEDTARMVNLAYIKAKNPQIDEDTLTNNWEQAKAGYAKQVLGMDKAQISDKELYSGISGMMKQQRDERTMLGEGLGHLFDSFRKGDANLNQTFTTALAEMRGKPGYDPKRLDVYRHLAEQTWQNWEQAGQHFPAVVDSVGKWYAMTKAGDTGEQGQLEARQQALRALATVPEEQQDAILGLAMRQASSTETRDRSFMEKAADRLEGGIGTAASDAAIAFTDLLKMQSGNYAGLVDSQLDRKISRKLDAAQSGALDPYHGSNAFSEGVLGATEGLPRMLAMFHPAGVAANLMAFSEEARGHFEDAGVAPEKAQALGVAASIPLTALQMVTSKTVVGEGVSSAVEGWMLKNIAGQTGAALAKGYAKNLLTLGAENTATLATVTYGQQLTEPALQSLGNVLDGTIPGVKWTGKDGELAKVANATPETLASLVPLIALGVGTGTLRTRGSAIELRTIQNEPALKALGLTPQAIKDVMAAKTPEDATLLLQEGFKDRKPNVSAVDALNSPERVLNVASRGADGKIHVGTDHQTIADSIGVQASTLEHGFVTSSGRFVSREEAFSIARKAGQVTKITGRAHADNELGSDDLSFSKSVDANRAKIALAPEGGYTVKDGQGNPIATTDTAEMAAKVAQEYGRDANTPVSGATRNADGSFTIFDKAGEPISRQEDPSTQVIEPSVVLTQADRARIRAEESGNIEERGTDLLDWIKGRLPRPDVQAASGGRMAGELRGIWDNLVRENKNGDLHGKRAEAFFAKKGVDVDLDRLTQEANAEGFNFETPAKLLEAVDNAQRGNRVYAQPIDNTQLGIAAGGGKVGEVLNQVVAQAKEAAKEVSTLPEFKGFREVLNKWVGDNQIATMHTAGDIRTVIDQVPDMAARRAIGRWLDANGDLATLERNRDNSINSDAKREYANALKLTPEQVKVAESIREWFKARFDRAVAAGVMEESRFREGYLTHLIERPFVQGGEGSKFGADLNKNFKYSQERTFPNLFELEKADYKVKTTDVAEIMARYDAALNKAILSRQLVKDLLTAKNAAGEPLAVPLKGNLRPAEGDSNANFITNPRQKMVDQVQGKLDQLSKEIADLHDTLENGTVQERFDAAEKIKDLREEVKMLRDEQSPEDAKLYRSIDHPALRKWWWIGKDGAGKDTFMEGDIGLHPEIANHLENALGASELRKWYDSNGNALSAIPKVLVKALDRSNSFLKANLLGGISVFHAKHELVRAAGNRVLIKPWDLAKIDPNDPRVKMQVRTGLMLTSPHDVENVYAEGLGGRGSLVDKLPLVGKLSRGVSDYTFSKLIPAIKSEVWNHVYERNLETFKDAIANGTASKEQVAYLTSNQINARFGHLNYADIGRDPTFQHFLRIATLAPDFWESNIRNYAQSAAGLTGAKVGREPAIALAVTAAGTWLVARALNMALDDDPHYDKPFAVVTNGREYTIRQEAEDLWRAFHNFRGYIMGRESPSSQLIEELKTARNWRGEKITSGEAFKDWISKVFPMSLRFLPGIKETTDSLESGGGRTITVWQQFLGSLGIQVSRNTPLNDAYQLANDWRKSKGDVEDRGTYPVSKYQQLRYALEDKDESRAIQEIANLRKAGEPIGKLSIGFHSSLFHAWTGSRKKDEEFKASLKPDDLAKVQKAEAHRTAVFQRYLKLISHLSGGGEAAALPSSENSSTNE